MKYLILLSILLWTASTSAQEKNQINPGFFEDFGKLSKEEQQQYRKDSLRANQLYKDKKIKECLALIEVINKKLPSDPAINNLAGACHVENKDFEKATASFKRVLAILPNNLNAAFNLAEVEFVTKDFKAARTHFEGVRQSYLKKGQMVAAMETLCHYKVFLCHLMLGEKEQAQEIAAVFEKQDPKALVHFYSQIALSLNAKDLETAEEWLEKSKETAPENPQLTIYQDSLAELGYFGRKQELILPR